MFDLISAIELTASAAVVSIGLALIFGATLGQRMAIAAAMAAWFVAVIVAGATRALYYDGGLGVPGLAVAIALPVIVLSAFALGTRTGRERVAVASMPALVALQGVRVLGVTFVLLHAAGRLPAPFAPVAGWGDIAVGLLALPVAWLAARRPAGSGGAVLAWSLVGMADLATAVGLGATSSPGPVRVFFAEPSSAMMTTLPWIVIPCFVVPALMAVHIVTLVRLRGAARGRTRGLATALAGRAESAV